MSDEGGGESSGGGKVSSTIVVIITPHPSLEIVKFRQGIAEMIVRGIVLILLVVMFIASSVAEDEAANITDVPKVSNAKAAAGWTIFLGVIAFIYEVFFIACRFLNFGFSITYRVIYLIVDIIFNAVVALGLFAGAVSLAVGAEYLRQFIGTGTGFDDFLTTVTNALGAAAFFSFASMFGFIFLIVWVILYLVFKWDLKGASSSPSDSSP